MDVGVPRSCTRTPRRILTRGLQEPIHLESLQVKVGLDVGNSCRDRTRRELG
jgi:hypothetical protein